MYCSLVNWFSNFKFTNKVFISHISARKQQLLSESIGKFSGSVGKVLFGASGQWTYFGGDGRMVRSLDLAQRVQGLKSPSDLSHSVRREFTNSL